MHQLFVFKVTSFKAPCMYVVLCVSGLLSDTASSRQISKATTRGSKSDKVNALKATSEHFTFSTKIIFHFLTRPSDHLQRAINLFLS